MKHNEISKLCREELIKLLGISNERAIPTMPWDDYVFNYADTFHNDPTISEDELRNNFRILAESVLEGQRNPRPPSLSTALQRHHDYCVRLMHKRPGLKDHEMEQYNRAMERERQGLVKPLYL